MKFDEIWYGFLSVLQYAKCHLVAKNMVKTFWYETCWYDAPPNPPLYTRDSPVFMERAGPGSESGS